MKLRTVLNELGCVDAHVSREEVLNEDVLLTPEYDVPGLSDEARLLRLCTLEDYLDGRTKVGEDEALLVFSPGGVPEDSCPVGDVVIVSHPSSYEDFRMAFLDLPSKLAVLELRRERMFEAFLRSYDLPQFARRSSAVLGNPVVIINSDLKLLATAGNFPEDAPDVQEVLNQGYVSEDVTSDMESDGIFTAVRHAHHSVISDIPRHGRRWVTSLIYFHHLEMGRFDVVEKDNTITGFDLELIDFASQLAGVMIDRLGAAGERVGSGSTVLNDLIEGSFPNLKTMHAQLALTQLPLDGTYAMLALTGRPGGDRSYYEHVGSLISGSMRGCLWCARDNMLAMLVPMTRGDAVGYDAYARTVRRIATNKAFMSALDHNGLRTFVSEPFDDLSIAPSRFAQCQAMVGAADAIRGRVTYFWENRFVTLAATAGTFDQMEMMLDKRVVAMADYDREHGTAYLDTAIMSVRYPGSPAEAAAALNVHRNTYFYRMNKVRKLFYLDLKDGADRLALSFTAQIIRGLPERLPRLASAQGGQGLNA